MRTGGAEHDAAAFSATFCAAVMLGHQVAAKAARDALFLSSFDVDLLPRMIIAASIVSLLVAFAWARAMRLHSPRRMVPAAFAASAVLLVGEWLLGYRWPGAMAIAVYLHTIVFGAILASGFWSLVNERFDPRTAKRLIGRIAGGGTVGGLIGALAAERVGANLSVVLILPMLAGAHLLCAYFIRELATSDGHESSSHVASPAAQNRAAADADAIHTTSYLAAIAALVALTTIAAAFLDYVFKANVSANYAGGGSLIRIFAAFHAAIGVVSFGLQTFVTRRFLEKLGLTKAIVALPTITVFGTLGAIAVPGLAAVAAARGAEGVVRASLYRSGYELLYTPLRPDRKRSAKTIIDVAIDRLGEAVGGGVIAAVIFFAPASADFVLLALALALSAAAFAISLLLRSQYVRVLEQSLVRRAIELDEDALADAVTMGTVRLTLQGERLVARDSIPGPDDEPATEGAPGAPGGEAAAGSDAAMPASSSARGSIELDDEVLHAIADLRSGEADKIRSALSAISALGQETAVFAHVLPLIAFDEVRSDVEPVLVARVERIGGQLIDALLDRDEEFTLRRRIPAILGTWKNERAVRGLLAGLEDRRFEVRFQCGRALSRLRRAGAGLEIDPDRVYAAVRRAVAVDKEVWASQKLLDPADDADGAFADELLRERASRSMEHVFTLLALVLPREPLEVAFHGLYTDDPVLRGIALEYLETVLPADIRAALWPFLEESGKEQADEHHDRDRVLEALMRSRQSIQLNLEAARKRAKPV